MSLLFVFASCKKDEILENTPESLSDTAMKGNWEISYFWDSDKDETYHFSGFNFTFNENGVLTASNGSDSYTGTWSVRTSSSGLEMDISFSNPEDFTDLSDDWDVIEFAESSIELKDVSGGDGSVDYLTFMKI